MNQRKAYSDGVMKFLLERYERPGLDAVAGDALRAALRVEADASGGASRRLSSVRPVAARRFAAWTLSAAAGIAAMALGGLYLASRATSGAPWAVVGSDDVASAAAPEGWAGRGMKARSSEIRVDGGRALALESANETITMLPGTVLRVSGRFMHALTGEKWNVYTLTAGEVSVEHRAGSFELATPWAVVTPVGTALRVSVAEGRVRIACDQGAIDVRPLDGSEAYRLEEGEAVAAQQVGDSWLASRGVSSRVLPSGGSDGGSANLTDAPPDAPPAARDGPAKAEPAGSPASSPGAIAVDRGGGTAALSTARFDLAWSARREPDQGEVEDLYFDGASLFAYGSGSGGAWIAAYSAADGRRRGLFAVGGPYEKRAFDADRAYLLAGRELVAVALSSGAELWRTAVGPMGFAGMAAHAGRVYVPSADGALYVIDGASGKALRTLKVGAGLYGTPLPGSGKVVFSSIGKELLAYDAETWALSWKAPVPGGLLGDVPFMLGRLVVTQDSKGGILSFGIDDGTPAWSIPTGGTGAVKAYRASDGAVYQAGQGTSWLAADGATVALPPIAGAIIGAGASGIVATGEGLYLVRGGEVIVGPRVGAARAAVEGDSVFIATIDGRLERWRWIDR